MFFHGHVEISTVPESSGGYKNFFMRKYIARASFCTSNQVCISKTFDSKAKSRGGGFWAQKNPPLQKGEGKVTMWISSAPLQFMFPFQ